MQNRCKNSYAYSSNICLFSLYLIYNTHRRLMSFVGGERGLSKTCLQKLFQFFDSLKSFERFITSLHAEILIPLNLYNYCFKKIFIVQLASRTFQIRIQEVPDIQTSSMVQARCSRSSLKIDAVNFSFIYITDVIPKLKRVKNICKPKYLL